MKRVLLSATAALAIACAFGPTAAFARAEPAPITEAQIAKAARMGPWGFDMSGMDRSIRPGDDFVGFASGTYLKGLDIPADRTNWNSFAVLRELSERPRKGGNCPRRRTHQGHGRGPADRRPVQQLHG